MSVSQQPGALARLSVASTNSTYLHDLQPFAVIQMIRKLCISLWPTVQAGSFIILKMHGGSYNRIYEINIPAQTIDNEFPLEEPAPRYSSYILRIPKYAEARIQPEIATLAFLAGWIVPVPEIIMFDMTTKNPIQASYNIQLKMPGRRLDDIYDDLSQDDRLSIVSQIARILREMHRICSPTPGFLDVTRFEPGSEDTSTKLIPVVEIVDYRINIPGSWGVQDHMNTPTNSAKPESTYQLFIDQFDGWQSYDIEKGLDQYQAARHYGRLRAITRQMKQLGFLEDSESGFSLYHPDFAPRNILAQRDEHSDWKVTAVLDWDRTGFMPWSVACAPPSWVWTEEWGHHTVVWPGVSDDTFEDEAVRCNTPLDPYLLERKNLFDTLMGKRYTDCAYSTQLRFVRRLFYFASYGFCNAFQIKCYAKFYDEWTRAYGEPYYDSRDPGTEKSVLNNECCHVL